MTGTSTYARPLPLYPPFTPATTPTVKEKPLYKIPIPDTPWLRVKTNHGNVFFTHVERKESVWSVPEEIATTIADMDWVTLEEQAARQKEVAKVQKEVEREGLKRGVADTSPANDSDAPADHPHGKPLIPKKRKTRETLDEIPTVINTETVPVPAHGNGGNGEASYTSDSDAVLSTASVGEAWQRGIAEGFAELAEQQDPPAADTPATHVGDGVSSEPNSPQIQNESRNAFKASEHVNLSLEESRTLFKVSRHVSSQSDGH